MAAKKAGIRKSVFVAMIDQNPNKHRFGEIVMNRIHNSRQVRFSTLMLIAILSIFLSGVSNRAAAQTERVFFDQCPRPAEIHVRSGHWLDGITIVCADGQRFQQGGQGGDNYVFELQPGEFITRITGTRYAEGFPYVITLQLHTNMRSSQVYGGAGTVRGRESFDQAVPLGIGFLGFEGRAGQFLNELHLIAPRSELARSQSQPQEAYNQQQQEAYNQQQQEAYNRQQQEAYNRQVGDCRASFRQAHGEVVQIFQQAQSRGRINPAEVQQFQAAEGRLNGMRGQLVRDGMTLGECQQLLQAVGQERALVQRIAANDPGVDKCRAQAQEKHAQVGQHLNQLQAVKLNPQGRQLVAQFQQTWTQFGGALQNEALPLANCQAIAQQLGAMLGELQRASSMR